MLPSTPSSSASTNRPAPALAPVSAAAASTEPNLILRQRVYTGAVGITTTTTASHPTGTAGYIDPPTAAPELEAGPPPIYDPIHYQRGPSPSLHNQSPGSSSPLPGGRGNVSAILQDHRTRKRRIGPGTRGVANLTPEQLAKKRANDREAQRAIRERTKHQIEELEGRIRALTNQQPYQDLQKVTREKEAAEAKNAELKDYLASIMTGIQNVLSSDTVGCAFTSPVPTYNPVQPAQQQQSLSSYSDRNSLTPGNESTPHSGVDASWHNPALLPSGSPLNSDNHDPNISVQQPHDDSSNLPNDKEQPKFDFLLDSSHRSDRMQTGANEARGSPSYQHSSMNYDWGASINPRHENNTPLSSGSPLPPAQQHQYTRYTPDPSSPSQTPGVGVDAPIKHVLATCPIDNLLLNFMRERRQRAAEGMPTCEVIGPEHPSFTSLLNPESDAYVHPVSKVFTDILSKFSALDSLPERVAALHVMFHIMRWHISPTPENFKLLPPFCQPLDVQYERPHPAWIDYLPFPAMRERFVRSFDAPGWFDFDVVFMPFLQTVSLNWPHGDRDVLLEAPDGSEVIINPFFQRHIHEIGNWSLGDAFDRAFPALRGTYKLKSEGGAGVGGKGGGGGEGEGRRGNGKGIG